MEKFTYIKCMEILQDLNSIKTPSFADLKDVEDKHKYVPSGKFLYAVAKNISRLESIQKTLNKVIEQTDEFNKYQEERNEINKQFAVKDENDQPKMKDVFFNGQQTMSYVIKGIDDPNSAYSKKLAELKKKYKNAIDEMNEKGKRYDELLMSESEFIPFVISIDDVPEGLSTEAWRALYYIVKESENEKTDKKK